MSKLTQFKKSVIVGSAIILTFVGASAFAQQQAEENVVPMQRSEASEPAATQPDTIESAAEPIERPVEPVTALESTGEPSEPVGEPVAPAEQPKAEPPVITPGMGGGTGAATAQEAPQPPVESQD